LSAFHDQAQSSTSGVKSSADAVFFLGASTFLLDRPRTHSLRSCRVVEAYYVSSLRSAQAPKTIRSRIPKKTWKNRLISSPHMVTPETPETGTIEHKKTASVRMRFF